MPQRLAEGRPLTDLPTATARVLRKRLTPQEARLWMSLLQLRQTGLHFRRQVAIGRYIVDFACLKRQLIVEVDGGKHGREDHAARDRDRDAALSASGFLVLRFWNAEVDRDLLSIMETIVARADASRPHPGSRLRRDSALPCGEGEPALP